jgi:hypothetical protein
MHRYNCTTFTFEPPNIGKTENNIFVALRSNKSAKFISEKTKPIMAKTLCLICTKLTTNIAPV